MNKKNYINIVEMSFPFVFYYVCVLFEEILPLFSTII